ncbi:MAG: hypothetical protein H7X94_14820 [Vallitaleaceae bacterium]|nr:hypothetical protein [Vallitaleaceae bacterium]
MKRWILLLMMVVALCTLISCTDKNPDANAKEPSLKSYGFTETFDPEKVPTGTVGTYRSTDTIYFVAIARNFPKGTNIHQVWEYVTDGSTVEGDLIITQDMENNYLGFNLTPKDSFPVGDYKVYLTWTIDGVKGKLESLAIAIKE